MGNNPAYERQIEKTRFWKGAAILFVTFNIVLIGLVGWNTLLDYQSRKETNEILKKVPMCEVEKTPTPPWAY